MTVPYNHPGIRLARGTADRAIVKALQLDLRCLGYLRGDLDGVFGSETERAVRALQHDLISTRSVGADGDAPVALTSFNRGRIGSVDGVVDEHLAQCLEDLLSDARVTQLPRSDDPEGANQRVRDILRTLETPTVPRPFLLAILEQESGLRHFQTPSPMNPDDFIVVGLDRNDQANPDRITSRGYGIGQYTLFHHPPTPAEVAGVMLDPVKNVERATRELKTKFDGFLVGRTSGTRADDRIAAVGRAPLRPCRYVPGDPRFQTDCRRCAMEAPRMSIRANAPVFPGASEHLTPTQYHSESHYNDLPDWRGSGATGRTRCADTTAPASTPTTTKPRCLGDWFTIPFLSRYSSLGKAKGI